MLHTSKMAVINAIVLFPMCFSAICFALGIPRIRKNAVKKYTSMKILGEDIKKIILDEQDELIITTLKKNKREIHIKMMNGALHIEDLPIKRIEQMKDEEELIQTMRNNIQERSKK